jgi:hypothetical protein
MQYKAIFRFASLSNVIIVLESWSLNGIHQRKLKQVSGELL